MARRDESGIGACKQEKAKVVQGDMSYRRT